MRGGEARHATEAQRRESGSLWKKCYLRGAGVTQEKGGRWWWEVCGKGQGLTGRPWTASSLFPNHSVWELGEQGKPHCLTWPPGRGDASGGRISGLCYLFNDLVVFDTWDVFCFGCVFGANLSLLLRHVKQVVCNVCPSWLFPTTLHEHLSICPFTHWPIIYPVSIYLVSALPDIGSRARIWRPNMPWSTNDWRTCQLMEGNVSAFVWGLHTSKHILQSNCI